MKGFRTPTGMWLPGRMKKMGGSRFDDELETADTVMELETREMVKHINERPDHIVYVEDADARDKMRAVFNHWKKIGRIGHNPNIRIEYALSDGAFRIGE